MIRFELDRRALLRSFSGLAAAALAPSLGPSLGPSLAAAATPDALAAWRAPGTERDAQRLTVEGRFPADLRGVFYRNGPTPQTAGGGRGRHWFDGDGLMQAWRINGPDAASYRSRFVATHKRQAETAAGRPLFPTFSERPPNTDPLTPPHRLNPSNINALPINGRLLALWETGPAWELDPATLETLGEVAWRPDLRGLAFSAHPKIDPSGEVWNFGVNYPGGEMMVWRIGANGGLKRFAVLKIKHPGMLHDVAITEKSLIFALTPYFLDPEKLAAGQNFLDAHDWRPDQPIRLIAVDKDDHDKLRIWEAPAGFGFHFSNAWEEADGTIRFDFTLADDPGVVARRLAGVMAGRWADAAPLRLTSFVLRPGGRVEIAALTSGASEFPRIDPAAVGRRHDAVFHLENLAGGSWFDGVVRRDGDGAPQGAYRYPAGQIPEEHVFVPQPGGGAGWVLGTVIDVASDRHGLTVFAAARLSDGPLATAWLPGFQPPGLHGAFAAA